jgi:hypothetical protein
MAFNVVDFLKGQMTPDRIQALAGALGEDPGKVGTALSSATPALLGALASSLSQPAGTRQLEQALDRTDTSVLDNFAGAVGGSGGSMMDAGSKLLGMLFGGDTTAKLASALASYSGLSGKSSGSLLSLAAPLLLGALKRKSASEGMDVGGLASMLLGQRQQIANAIPSGLGNALAGTGVLQGVADTGARATADIHRVSHAAARETREVAAEGGSFLRKIVPLALLLIAAFALWQWFSRPSDDVAQPAVDSAAMTATGEVGELMNDSVESLRSITSVDTAQGALANLDSVNRSLDNLTGLAANLPGTAREALAAAISRGLPALQAAAQAARQIPGVNDVIGPTVDSIEAKLIQLSTR